MSRVIDKVTWDRAYKKGVLEEDDTQGVTDWERRYKEGNDSKYGTLMYSPSLDRLRHITFSEFYGNGIVD